MKKQREEGSGIWRAKRGNPIPVLMLLVFVVLVGVTTLINMHNPLTSYQSHTEKDSNLAHTGKSDHDGSGEEPITPYSPTRGNPYGKSLSGWASTWHKMLPGIAQREAFYCDRSHIRTDVCRMHGNVHLKRNSAFVLHSVDEKTPLGEEKIKPYTRKWEKSSMEYVRELTLKSVRAAESNSSRVCDVWHSVPAVAFSTGGYTGNLYHEFHDGLIPLFITTQHLKGEVILVISDYHEWWVMKYAEILKQLTNYDIIVYGNHTKSHCFLDVTVGLFIHQELGVDSSIMPHHESIKDFRALLGRGYSAQISWTPADITSFRPTRHQETKAILQMVIIEREGSRVLLNLEQIVELATGMGFNVMILKPEPSTELKKIFWLLDRCDVLIGVHGAALTHFLFLRPGSVFIQIIPLGTDWAARTYYQDPAEKLGLEYLDYKIAIEESSLSHQYEKTDPVLTNPNAVIRRGWGLIKEIYLEGQDVELSLPRFNTTLKEAKMFCKPRLGRRERRYSFRLGSSNLTRRKQRRH